MVIAINASGIGACAIHAFLNACHARTNAQACVRRAAQTMAGAASGDAKAQHFRADARQCHQKALHLMRVAFIMRLRKATMLIWHTGSAIAASSATLLFRRIRQLQPAASFSSPLSARRTFQKLISERFSPSAAAHENIHNKRLRDHGLARRRTFFNHALPSCRQQASFEDAAAQPSCGKGWRRILPFGFFAIELSRCAVAARVFPIHGFASACGCRAMRRFRLSLLPEAFLVS
ncbi:MAG: hypothetical protein Q4A28_09125 [Brachymonas sp.]|nr:hypothetical protein [Brachymonas sp.]MDO4796081.1 hypothetical protein [Brachymonas sp.]